MSACSKEARDKPTELMHPLYSFSSLQKVQRDLQLRPESFDIVEDRRPLPSDTRPPFRYLVIAIKHTENLGVSGDAQLTFFNDRLMETWFFPSEMPRYQTALQNERGVAFGSYTEASIAPATRVWIGKRDEGRAYVGWVDKRLQRERNDWLAQYAK
jgi:hypothetical protein